MPQGARLESSETSAQTLIHSEGHSARVIFSMSWPWTVSKTRGILTRTSRRLATLDGRRHAISKPAGGVGGALRNPYQPGVYPRRRTRCRTRGCVPEPRSVSSVWSGGNRVRFHTARRSSGSSRVGRRVTAGTAFNKNEVLLGCARAAWGGKYYEKN